jgi:hypothetical protein
MITLGFSRNNGSSRRQLALAASTLFVVGALHAQTPEPVTYLTFDEGSGTYAADSVGDHSATLLGGAGWTTGIVGSHALNLPGAYADMAAPVLDTTKSFTVAAWVKLNNTNGYQTFVSEDTSVEALSSCSCAVTAINFLLPFPTTSLSCRSRVSHRRRVNGIT